MTFEHTPNASVEFRPISRYPLFHERCVRVRVRASILSFVRYGWNANCIRGLNKPHMRPYICCRR